MASKGRVESASEASKRASSLEAADGNSTDSAKQVAKQAAAQQRSGARVTLPKMTPRFERCPDMKPGESSAGRWSMRKMATPNGTMIYISYDGKPVTATIAGVVFSSFDINMWQGKETDSCKVGCAAMKVKGLPDAAWAKIETSFAQFIADQSLVKHAMLQYMQANGIHQSLPDPDTGELKPPAVKTACSVRLLKSNAPHGQAADAKPEMIYQFRAALKTERGTGSVVNHRILTPIILMPTKPGQPLRSFTRGELQTYLSEKRRLYRICECELIGFYSSSTGCFLTARSTKEILMPLTGGGLSKEEEIHLANEAMGEVTSLGFDMSQSDDPDIESSPSTAATAASAAASAATAEQEDDVEGFESM